MKRIVPGTKNHAAFAEKEETVVALFAPVLVLFVLNIFLTSFLTSTGWATTGETVELSLEERRWLGEQTAAQGIQTEFLALTPEERDWIAQHPFFRVGTFSLPPYIIQNKQNIPNKERILTGYMPDLLRAISNRVGLTPEFIQFDQLTQVLTQAEQGKIEVAMAMIKTEERAQLFTFSAETMPLNMAIFARIDDQSITGLSSLQQKRGAFPKSRNVLFLSGAQFFQDIRINLWN
ncbi:MAG: hypothetical protein D3916_19195 [Candidatus Electrothrix sp. MAN1_4]|nr:hypothetical protein [Candidatus Electrothrix sp. MAN1_4]